MRVKFNKSFVQIILKVKYVIVQNHCKLNAKHIKGVTL